ncbi:MAG: restriction endonuclease [Thiobacillus sp.]|nr:restriction endonuclease [Thiobacillus sp.]
MSAAAQRFSLSEQDQKELLPSGRESRFKNRVYWARAYLGQAKLLDSTGRGRFRITDRGQQLLKTKPPRVDIKLLGHNQEFQEFRSKTQNQEEAVSQPIPETESVQSPEELLETSYQTLRQQLALSLLAQVRQAPPDFFEQLVVDLLIAMGYGGSRKDAGQAIGKSSDGGIDGIIKEDRLSTDEGWEQETGILKF